MTAPTQEAVKFIQYQKYNQRYALMFDFITGILSETYESSENDLFSDAIEGAPIDLVGIRHIQLMIRSLEAASSHMSATHRTRLVKWIAHTIQYNILQQNDVIWQQISRSLETAQCVACDKLVTDVLISLPQHDETEIVDTTLWFISKLALSKPSATMCNLIATFCHHKTEKLRTSACDLLGYMGENAATNEVITKLVSTLADDNGLVSQSAYFALGTMSKNAARNKVISKLLSSLADESERIRSSACEALRQMGEKAATDEVIGKLVSDLADEKEWIRSEACYFLGKIGEKAATNEVIDRLVVTLADESEDVRRSACYAVGRMGEKAATNKVIRELICRLSDMHGHQNYDVENALKNILRSASTLMKLNPKILEEYLLRERNGAGSESFSSEKLLNILSDSKNSDWISVIIAILLVRGSALTMNDEKLVIYENKEPLEIDFLGIKYRRKIRKRLLAQAERYHLTFQTRSKDRKRPLTALLCSRFNATSSNS